jgi:hypothetical protein
VTLDHAHDALIDQIGRFHEAMKSENVRELEPRQWLEKFVEWLQSELRYD